MKSKRAKELFLNHIKKVPIIQVACEKSGISRATIYRWKDKNKKFKKELETALREGEDLVNDMSESQLISLIRDKNFSAIRFWLNHRHNKFRDKLDVTAHVDKQEELTPDQKDVIRKALHLASYNNDNLNNKQTYGQKNDKESDKGNSKANDNNK